MKNLLIAIVLSTSSIAFAGVLTLEPGNKSIEGVNVATGATAVVEGRVSELESLGAGLRNKKVGFLNVKVYVGQVFSSDPSKFVRSLEGHAALESLSDMQTVALQMLFVRDVSAAQIETAYADGFDANGLGTNVPHVNAFMQAVAKAGDALAGKPLTVVGEKLEDGTEAITYEGNDGKSVTFRGPAGTVRDVMSLWLGETADSGSTEFKKTIIRGN